MTPEIGFDFANSLQGPEPALPISRAAERARLIAAWIDTPEARTSCPVFAVPSSRSLCSPVVNDVCGQVNGVWPGDSYRPRHHL